MGRWGEKMGYGRRRVACSLLRAAAAGGLRGEVSGGGIDSRKQNGGNVCHIRTHQYAVV